MGCSWGRGSFSDMLRLGSRQDWWRSCFDSMTDGMSSEKMVSFAHPLEPRGSFCCVPVRTWQFMNLFKNK